MGDCISLGIYLNRVNRCVYTGRLWLRIRELFKKGLQGGVVSKCVMTCNTCHRGVNFFTKAS